MKTPVKVLLITLAVGIPVFLLEPNGPLGGFWEPHADLEDATGIQVPLFIILGVAEALLFGLGVAFVGFGYPLLNAIRHTSNAWTKATYVSIAWMFLSWWAHGSLHVHNGSELNGLLAIEYGFHLTLMAAALIIAYFFLTTLRQEAAKPARGSPRLQPEALLDDLVETIG